MKTTATNRKLRLLITAISDGTLIPKPEFQRRLVWSNKHKLDFIETVLTGYPFPEIYIASGDVDPDTGKGSEMLVDGQQRITTLYQYFRGSSELRLSSKFKPYSALDDKEKINFLEYEVVVRDLGKMEISEIKEIFKKINSTNYSLNAMEVHNARYDGAFKKFCERLSQHKLFSEKKIFSSSDYKRMHDIRFCIGLTITCLSSYFNRDDEFEAYLDRYNEIFDIETKVHNNFIEVFKIIDGFGLEDDSRAWKKADFFSLFVESYRAYFKRDLKSIGSYDVIDRLKSFYYDVDYTSKDADSMSIVNLYYKNSLQGTNDRSNRIIRGEIIQHVLDPSYKPDLKLAKDISYLVPSEIKSIMESWFLSRYEDPSNNCPYESAEGGFQYIWGGPYDAYEELSSEFSGVYPDEIIENLADELNDVCFEWSGIPSHEGD